MQILMPIEHSLKYHQLYISPHTMQVYLLTVLTIKVIHFCVICLLDSLAHQTELS